MVQKANYKSNGNGYNGNNGHNGEIGLVDIKGHSTDYLFERARHDSKFSRDLLGEIFNQHQELISRLFLRYRPVFLDKDDFLDEMMFLLVTKWFPSFNPSSGASFTTYVRACTRNARIDLYRKNKANKTKTVSLDEIDTDALVDSSIKNPLEEILDNEMKEKVELTLDWLSRRRPLYASALRLSSEGFDTETAAVLQDCSEETYRWRKRMAVKSLREKLLRNYPKLFRN